MLMCYGFGQESSCVGEQCFGLMTTPYLHPYGIWVFGLMWFGFLYWDATAFDNTDL